MNGDEVEIELTPIERQGYTTVMTSGGLLFYVHPDEFEAIDSAWERGAAWFVGRGVFGQRVRIKLAAVICVARWTPDELTDSRCDEAAERSRKRRRELAGDTE